MKRNQLFSTRNLSLMAALVAIQIILSRFLAIQASDTLRISFETVPLALAGFWLGPLAGALVALVSDFLGMCLFGQGTYFPLIALGPMLYAAMCGWSAKYVFRSDLAETRDTLKVVLTVVVAGIVNAFGVGVITTTLYQMIIVGREDAFSVLAVANFIGRLSTKPITIIVDTLLVTVINRAVYKPVIRRIVSRA